MVWVGFEQETPRGKANTITINEFYLIQLSGIVFKFVSSHA